MPETKNRPMLTRREVVEIADVALAALDKAIEQGVVKVHRRLNASWLRSEDVGVLVLLQKAGLPLPLKVKRQITRWVRDTEPYRAGRDSDLQISDALIVRWSAADSDAVLAAESYARLRDEWIEANPGIKGGEPVIRGTRVGVRAVAQRIDDGDSVETLAEDYPQIPAEAFQIAYTYAKAHPLRGRPARPWRGTDEAVGR